MHKYITETGNGREKLEIRAYSTKSNQNRGLLLKYSKSILDVILRERDF